MVIKFYTLIKIPITTTKLAPQRNQQSRVSEQYNVYHTKISLALSTMASHELSEAHPWPLLSSLLVERGLY